MYVYCILYANRQETKTHDVWYVENICVCYKYIDNRENNKSLATYTIIWF